jgi:hypothetical protein
MPPNLLIARYRLTVNPFPGSEPRQAIMQAAAGETKLAANG